LGLVSVVAISMSAMLGSGIFVLPGLAAAKTGPMIWLAYLCAGLTVLPAALSKSELATAMPTSGGTYVYLERTFGPLVGTISGIGLWLSLLLKSAFALVGFGAYLSVIVAVPLKPVAVALLLLITILNISGVSVISKFQKFVLAGVLIALCVLMVVALPKSSMELLRGGFTHGLHGFLAATAFVYVSYAGVTKIAAIAEEVKNPNRNLPLGILISWLAVVCIYVAVVYVLVSVVPAEELASEGGTGKADLHPIYTLANSVAGQAAGWIAAILAIVTMVSMAISGLLAASRFPFAMSRDELLPDRIHQISSYFKTPVNSIVLTSLIMAICILFLPVEQIAKLASAFMILAFMFVCGTVVVLREIAGSWYQPGFRSPLYPFTQIVGVICSIVLLSAMGLTSLFAVGCLFLAGALSYYFYGKRKTTRLGVIHKMGRRRDLIVENGDGLVHTLEEELPPQAAVVVPLFGNERSPESLVEMGSSIAHGRKLEVLHITAVPEQVYLADVLEEDKTSVALKRRMVAMAEAEEFELEYNTTVSRDTVRTIHDVATRLECEWVVMEASGRRKLGVSFQNPLGWLQDHLACNLAVYKDFGVRYIRQILVFIEPGPHDSLVVTTADHLGQVYNAELNFVYYIADGEEPVNIQARGDYIDQLRDLCVSPTRAVVLHGQSEMAAIEAATVSYDLMIMGAAPKRTVLGRIFGSAKDRLTRQAGCSVLWLKTPVLQTHEALDVVHLPLEKGFDLLRLVHSDCIATKLPIAKKEQLFRTAADQLDQQYPGIGAPTILAALWEREQIQNTSVGGGVAIPHATLLQGNNIPSAVSIITTAEPVNYGSINEEKVDILFFTTSSPENRQAHLKVLAEISRLCSQTEFLAQARQAETPDQLLETLKVCLKRIHPENIAK
jgi:APA family basic amino acid/polyamine antiporter